MVRSVDSKTMEIFLALAILGVVFAVFTAANRSVKQTNRAWADAAGRLGLDFQPGSPLKRRAIRGSHGAIRIDLTEKSGGNNNTLREWRLAYPSTPFSMTLMVETPGKKLLKAFGAQDFEIGDPAFDAKFMVAGSDQSAIARFLDSDRRAALMAAAERMPGVKITNSDVSWRTSNQYKDPSALIDDAKLLLQTAAAMSEGGRLPAPGPVAAPFSTPPVAKSTAEDPWVASHELPAWEPDARQVTPKVEPEVPVQGPAADELPVQTGAGAQPDEPGESGGHVRLEDMIEEVFGTRRLSFEANKLVAEKYAGRALVVVGPVRTVRKESRDFDFRDQGPGFRVEAVVGEVTGTRVGAGEVIAIAYLEGATAAPERGDEVLITGTILKVEPLRRAVYLVDAQLG